MQKIFTISIALSLLMISQLSRSQGCVAVRQMGGCGISSGSGYNLSKGDVQAGINYRYFHSWRHFVGTEEQKERQYTNGGIGADGKDHGNAVNIYSHAIDINVSYGLSDRFQLNVTLPWVHNERSQVLRQTLPVKDTFRYSVFASGIADVRFGANYWVFDPATSTRGNLMVGLGVKLNTGSYTKTDQAPQTNGTIRYAVMDQAIQPGDGGIGYTVEFQAFRTLQKNLIGFASGYYLFNPKENNGSFKSAPKAGLEGYNIYACPDQYFGRAGVMLSASDKLSLSLAGRMEGIPAYDAFGGQVAYRRPGYVVAIEPGVTYRNSNHSFSLFIPFNIVRNRIQSAADIADQNLQNSKIEDPAKYVHVQGDAAFADYSINFGYAYRFSTMKHAKMIHMD